MRKLLEALDKIPPLVLPAANSAVALLIVVAHRGALLISHFQSSPDAESVRRLATISLPSAAFVLLSAAVVLIHRL